MLLTISHTYINSMSFVLILPMASSTLSWLDVQVMARYVHIESDSVSGEQSDPPVVIGMAAPQGLTS